MLQTNRDLDYKSDQPDTWQKFRSDLWTDTKTCSHTVCVFFGTVAYCLYIAIRCIFEFLYYLSSFFIPWNAIFRICRLIKNSLPITKVQRILSKIKSNISHYIFRPNQETQTDETTTPTHSATTAPTNDSPVVDRSECSTETQR